jgi:hypothetical protein
MISALASELGPWSWWIIGLVFLGLEILIPGVFLLWIGLAALVVGALSFMFWDMAAWSWQVQVLIFAVLSLVFAMIGRRVSRTPAATAISRCSTAGSKALSAAQRRWKSRFRKVRAGSGLMTPHGLSMDLSCRRGARVRIGRTAQSPD